MGRLIFTKRAGSSTPEAGKVALYAKNDGKLYVKKEDGTESEVGSGGGGGEPVDYPITIDKGGTGATTAQAALNAITNVAAASDGYVLTKIGGAVSWAAPSNGSGAEAGLPDPTGSNSNDVLVSTGTAYTLVDDTQFVSAAGAVMKSSLSSKGALISASAPGTVSVLSAGTAGKVLAANPNTVSGLEWQDRAALTGSTVNAIPRVTGANALAASQVTIDANGLLTAPTIQVNGNISVTGSVDGRDVGNDGAKLDGIKKDNTTATADPGASNNTSQGYSAGSRWINTSTTPAKLFVCTAATSNAATWKQVSTTGTGITKEELAVYGTVLTPVTSASPFNIGTEAETYEDLRTGSALNGGAAIGLNKARPPSFSAYYNNPKGFINPYARQIRMPGARGLLVDGYPAVVQVFGGAPSTPGSMASGSTARLSRVLDFGTSQVLPTQYGVLHLQISASFKFTSIVSPGLNTPSFLWFLVASPFNDVDPAVSISGGGTTVVNGTGSVVARGKVYSPVVLNLADGQLFSDDCRVYWDLTVDFYRTGTDVWRAYPHGMVTAFNRNALQGTLGDSKSYPVDTPATSDLYTFSTTAGLDTYTGFEPHTQAKRSRPRLALYFMQTGVNNANINTDPDTYADNQATGISEIKLHATGQFAPRVNRASGGLRTDQYLDETGFLSDYNY